MKAKEFVVNLSFTQLGEKPNGEYQASISFYPVFATNRENAVLLAQHMMKIHGASSYTVPLRSDEE
jgi:hypothetical protein